MSDPLGQDTSWAVETKGALRSPQGSQQVRRSETFVYSEGDCPVLTDGNSGPPTNSGHSAGEMALQQPDLGLTSVSVLRDPVPSETVP